MSGQVAFVLAMIAEIIAARLVADRRDSGRLPDESLRQLQRDLDRDGRILPGS